MRHLILLVAFLCIASLPCQGTEVQLTQGSGDCRAPAWCDNGHIAFSSDRYGASDIWAMDEDGEAVNTWRITQNPAHTDFEPTWNAACSHVYFSGSTGGDYRIYYINSGGSPYQPIAVGLASGNNYAPHAGDGGVVFHADRAGNDDIMWMPLGGESSSTYLTTDGADDRYPVWSPDQAHVAFASNRSGNWDIWMMDAAGESREVWQLTTNTSDETQPSFSPGGDRIAFHRTGVGIVAIDIASRAEHQLTSNPSDTEPCWSPDGNIVAFARQSGGEYHIWTTDDIPQSGVSSETSWGRVKALYR